MNQSINQSINNIDLMHSCSTDKELLFGSPGAYFFRGRFDFFTDGKNKAEGNQVF